MLRFLAGFKPLSRSLLPFLFLPTFSTRQIAIISSKIIDIITKETADDNRILGETLRNLTVQHIDFGNDDKNENNQQKSLDEVKELFTTGVQLDQCYRQQQRVTSSQTQSNKFVFYPTWITTTQVFAYINKHEASFIFTGDRGVGKTISFILYTILMNNIAKFATTSNQDQLGELFDKGMIKIPRKFIYWNYQGVLQMVHILMQCPEMYDHDRKSKKYKVLLAMAPYDLCQQIKQFYNEGQRMQTVVIIDQINELASKFREYNKLIEGKQCEFMQHPYLIDKLGNIFKNNQSRQYVASIGRQVIYNSREIIEDQLVRNTMRKRHESMILEGHQKLLRLQLSYYSRTGHKKARDEVAYYVELQYGRIFPSLTDAQIQLKTKNFMNHLQFALPLLIIRQLIRQQKQEDIELYPRFLKNYFQNYFDWLQTRINSQSATSTIDKLKLSFVINYLYIEIRKLTLFRENKIISIRRDDIFEEMKQYFDCMKEPHEVNDFMDEEIFPYSQSIQTFHCTIPREYIEHILKPRSLHQMEKLMTFMKKLDYKSERGRFFIANFIEDLIIKGFIKCTQFVYPKRKFKFHTYKLCTLQHRTTFVQFNDYTQSKDTIKEDIQKTTPASSAKDEMEEVEYYKDNMSQVIAMAYKKGDEMILATPVYKYRQIKPASFASFYVDLCLAKFSKKEDKYYFRFIDVKVGSQLEHSEKNKQAKEFKRRLGLSLSSLNIKYEIQIFILCPKNTFPQDLAAYKEITFADIQSVQFKKIYKETSEKIKKYLLLLKD